jgi:hypothetical protein
MEPSSSRGSRPGSPKSGDAGGGSRPGSPNSAGGSAAALGMRERAITRAEDLSLARVEAAVLARLAELEVKPDRLRRAGKAFHTIAGQYPAAIGKAVSKKERDEEEERKGGESGGGSSSSSSSSSNLVYGEIHFGTFALALEKVRKKYGGLSEPGGVFVDVGSGTGKPVFAAMLMHEFDKVVGIEILEGLHQLSLELLAIWNENKATADVSQRTRATRVELVRGDALLLDWRDADVAFCNSTCFDALMMQQLAGKAELMKPGSFFITFTRRLPSARWQVLEYERHLMSWGDATVFIHQRKRDDDVAKAPGPERR